jgi:hypothetical protein
MSEREQVAIVLTAVVGLILVVQAYRRRRVRRAREEAAIAAGTDIGPWDHGSDGLDGGGFGDPGGGFD